MSNLFKTGLHSSTQFRIGHGETNNIIISSEDDTITLNSSIILSESITTPGSNGMIRFNGSNFQGYISGAWLNFDTLTGANMVNGLTISDEGHVQLGTLISDTFYDFIIGNLTTTLLSGDFDNGTVRVHGQLDGETVNGGPLISSSYIKLGTTVETTEGTVRYNGSNFQGYKNSSWYDLDEQVEGLTVQTSGLIHLGTNISSNIEFVIGEGSTTLVTGSFDNGTLSFTPQTELSIDAETIIMSSTNLLLDSTNNIEINSSNGSIMIGNDGTANLTIDATTYIILGTDASTISSSGQLTIGGNPLVINTGISLLDEETSMGYLSLHHRTGGLYVDRGSYSHKIDTAKVSNMITTDTTQTIIGTFDVPTNSYGLIESKIITDSSAFKYEFYISRPSATVQIEPFSIENIYKNPNSHVISFNGNTQLEILGQGHGGTVYWVTKTKYDGVYENNGGIIGINS